MARELLEEVPKQLVKMWNNFSGLCLTLTPSSVRRNRKKESKNTYFVSTWKKLNPRWE